MNYISLLTAIAFMQRGMPPSTLDELKEATVQDLGNYTDTWEQRFLYQGIFNLLENMLQQKNKKKSIAQLIAESGRHFQLKNLPHAEEHLSSFEAAQIALQSHHFAFLACLDLSYTIQNIDNIFAEDLPQFGMLAKFLEGERANRHDLRSIDVQRIVDAYNQSKARNSTTARTIEQALQSIPPSQARSFLEGSNTDDSTTLPGYRILKEVLESEPWYPGMISMGTLLGPTPMANSVDRKQLLSQPGVSELFQQGMLQWADQRSNNVFVRMANPSILRDSVHNRSMVLTNAQSPTAGEWDIKGVGLAHPHCPEEFDGLLQVSFGKSDPPYTLYGGMEDITAYSSAAKAEKMRERFEEATKRQVYTNACVFAQRPFMGNDIFPSHFVHVKPLVLPVKELPGAKDNKKIQEFIRKHRVEPPKGITLPTGIHWVNAEALLKAVGIPEEVAQRQHLLLYKLPHTNYRFRDFYHSGHKRNLALKAYLEDIGFEVTMPTKEEQQAFSTSNLFPQLAISRAGTAVPDLDAGIELAFDTMSRVAVLLDYIHNVWECTGSNEHGSIFIPHNLGRHSFDPDTALGDATQENLIQDLTAAQGSLKEFYHNLHLPPGIIRTLDRAFTLLLTNNSKAKDRILQELLAHDCPALVSFAKRKKASLGANKRRRRKKKSSRPVIDNPSKSAQAA